jgi:hypothetical protein
MRLKGATDCSGLRTAEVATDMLVVASNDLEEELHFRIHCDEVSANALALVNTSKSHNV